MCIRDSDYLETVEVQDQKINQSFRMPVQWVNRPNSKFRGFSGLIASGKINSGDEVRILPGGNTSSIKEIVTWDGNLETATAGKSVTIT